MHCNSTEHMPHECTAAIDTPPDVQQAALRAGLLLVNRLLRTASGLKGHVCSLHTCFGSYQAPCGR